MFKRILVPVDFSDFSLRSVEEAVALARVFKAEITLVHAVDNIQYAGVGGTFGPVYDTSSLLHELARSAREQLTALAAKLTKKGLRVRTVLEIGAPHEIVVRAAKRTKAELIVLSTHGRSGLAHVFIGSVAERVVRHAPCPVLTLRLPLAKARRRAARPRRAASK